MNTLDRLCVACGIALEYHDIWGQPHHVSDSAKRAFLGAMGFPAATDDEAAQALASLEAASWERLLPPVRVARRGEPSIPIDIALPAAAAEDEFSWTLTLENGERFRGTLRPADLVVTERYGRDGVEFARHTFPLPHSPEPGYHRFELAGEGRDPANMSLIVAPEECYRPATLGGEGRAWGLALQLYALRSRRNWGMGDFGDLETMIEICARQGAAVIALNPLHALFPDNPENAGPYGPSSRLFLNVLYLCVEAIPDFQECEEARRTVENGEFQATLRALRETEMVQYGAVAAAKLPILERLYRHFREHHRDADSDRGRAFRNYQSEEGEPLRRQTLFEALQAHFRSADPSIWGWPAWPEAYRDPDSPTVLAFARDRAERVEFYQYLQWQAALQLEAAGRKAEKLGIGLLLDLAVGVERGGGEAWGNQQLYALEASVGAPPDDFNLHGQNWGLPPFIPRHLSAVAHQPFIATLRENMRAAGALRIDHVMGLMRLFWVPAGGSAADGTYVSYPLEELLGIVALESQRNRCLVVGEDLGTVPDRIRQALHAQGVLSYRLLYFEREWDGGFKPPAAYPAQALAAITTHDLATLAGFWQGRDGGLRDELGLFPTERQREEQAAARPHARRQLLLALEREGLLPTGTGPEGDPQLTPSLVQAIHAYLARSPAKLMLAQLEDVFGQPDQVNLPGTTEELHPNWRRKLTVDIEEWAAHPALLGLSAALGTERGA